MSSRTLEGPFVRPVLMRKTRHRSRERVGWQFLFTATVYNLMRMRRLMMAVT